MTEQQPRRDDISFDAWSLARFADRLPAGGRYVIILTKSARKGEAWQVDVAEVKQSLELGKEGATVLPTDRPTGETDNADAVESGLWESESPSNGRDRPEKKIRTQ